jgi:hypothetical protein
MTWTYFENNTVCGVEDERGTILCLPSTPENRKTARTISLCPAMAGYIRESRYNVLCCDLIARGDKILKTLEG